MFLLRHADLLKWVYEWTIRVLMPRRLRKAAALHRYALRDAFMMPLTPRDVDELDWYFRARRGEVLCPSAATKSTRRRIIPTSDDPAASSPIAATACTIAVDSSSTAGVPTVATAVSCR